MQLIKDFITEDEADAFINSYKMILRGNPSPGSERLNQKSCLWVGGYEYDGLAHGLSDMVTELVDRIASQVEYGELYEPQWVVEYEAGAGLPLHCDYVDNEGCPVMTAILNFNIGIGEYVCERGFVDLPERSLLVANTSSQHGYAGDSLRDKWANRYSMLFRVDSFESEALFGGS